MHLLPSLLEYWLLSLRWLHKLTEGAEAACLEEAQTVLSRERPHRDALMLPEEGRRPDQHVGVLALLP